jgi:hypothetical protein
VLLELDVELAGFDSVDFVVFLLESPLELLSDLESELLLLAFSAPFL